jgi:hypothetical protein
MRLIIWLREFISGILNASSSKEGKRKQMMTRKVRKPNTLYEI